MTNLCMLQLKLTWVVSGIQLPQQSGKSENEPKGLRKLNHNLRVLKFGR